MNILYVRVFLGADPEFFFKKEGKVIGAEKVIKKEGERPILDGMEVTTVDPLIIIDGVQAEFNPPAHYCRESFASNLRGCFFRLNESISGKKVEVDFGASVEVSKDELKSLAPENQTFGCSPSQNAYKESKIKVKDASKYYNRSAGGHIHLGVHNDDSASQILRTDPKKVTQMLDILLGNTCVLLDRDPGNIERRKNYGRAGEYRTPAHGLEYRTLSNFWLRSYPMMSFVLGMARFSVAVAADPVAEKAVLDLVDLKKIEKAINKNDFELAYENFLKIRDLVASMTHPGINDSHPYYHLEGTRMQAFEKLVADGVNTHFPEDPMTHWLSEDWRWVGWERFADSLIA